MVGAARSSQVEESHRRDRVLVHAVDGIPFDDRAVACVIVPPPLARITLQRAETIGAPVGSRKGLGVGVQRGKPRKRLDRVCLVGEAADVSTKAAERRRRKRVREDARRSLGVQKPLPADVREVGGVGRRGVDREGGHCGAEDPRRVDRGERDARADGAGEPLDEPGIGREENLGGRPGDESDGAGFTRVGFVHAWFVRAWFMRAWFKRADGPGDGGLHEIAGSGSVEDCPLGLHGDRSEAEGDDRRIAKVAAFPAEGAGWRGVGFAHGLAELEGVRDERRRQSAQCEIGVVAHPGHVNGSRRGDFAGSSGSRPPRRMRGDGAHSRSPSSAGSCGSDTCAGWCARRPARQGWFASSQK